MSRLFGVFGVVLTVLLAGCGFQLRGESQLPFSSAFVEASNNSLLAPPLRQALAAQQKLAPNMESAPIRIRLLEERREKNILSLSGGGKVREYRLVYKVTLKVMDDMGNDLMSPIELQQIRDFSYDDALILAKDAEEASLKRAMLQDTLQQALRRLSYVKH